MKTSTDKVIERIITDLFKTFDKEFCKDVNASDRRTGITAVFCTWSKPPLEFKLLMEKIIYKKLSQELSQREKEAYERGRKKATRFKCLVDCPRCSGEITQEQLDEALVKLKASEAIPSRKYKDKMSSEFRAKT